YEGLSRDEILAARLQVRFDHEADDSILAGGDLARDLARDVDLTLIYLLAVRMAAIDHQALLEPGAGQLLGRSVDASGVVIRMFSAAQDDVAVLVSVGRDDGGVPLLGHRKEMVGVRAAFSASTAMRTFPS